MGLTSIFQRKPRKNAAPAPADAPADLVQQARTRARRRLTGAVVLVAIGVIGFPLLFETQPRPIPVDIPIEIPRKENAPPLAMPRTTRPLKPVMPAPASTEAGSAGSEVITETKADAGREVPGPAKAVPGRAEGPASPPTASAKAGRGEAAPQAATKPAPEKDTAARDGAGRYVVQIGAFTDSASARETRQKVEKLGLKTYTQVAETSQGNRIRVRIGPFASREEADRVQAKLKAAGAPAVVLML